MQIQSGIVLLKLMPKMLTLMEASDANGAVLKKSEVLQSLKGKGTLKKGVLVI